MEPASWTAIATAISIGSSVAGAVGAFADARNQAALSEHNARVAEADALAVRQAGEYERGLLVDKQKRFLATQRAAAGAAGVTMEGAPDLIQSESAADAMMDEFALRYSTSVQAARLRAQAAADRMQAKTQRQGAWFGAGRSLLTSAGSIAGSFGE